MARIPTLMPCKCGSKAVVEEYFTVNTDHNNRQETRYRVECPSCGKYGHMCKTRTLAAHAWNEEMLKNVRKV